MYYQSHEVLGTDLPIYAKKQEQHLFYEEILLLNEKPQDYEMVGYLQVNVNEQPMFQQVFVKKG